MNESFVFYESFFEAVQCLPDAQEQLSLFKAVCEYALKGTEPVLSPAARAVFCVMKPVVDSNRRRRESGKKGGRPAEKPMVSQDENQWFDEEKPMVSQDNNQWFEKEKPNENENEKGNVNETVTETVDEKEQPAPVSAPAAESVRERAPAAPKCPKITFGYDGDGKLHGVDEELISYWKKQFPALDVGQQLRNAESWLDSNRKRRKHDIKTFLTNWLIRNQERAGIGPPAGQYVKLDGNTPDTVSAEERLAFDGF